MTTSIGQLGRPVIALAALALADHFTFTLFGACTTPSAP
jgi:hypothetical protein